LSPEVYIQSVIFKYAISLETELNVGIRVQIFKFVFEKPLNHQVEKVNLYLSINQFEFESIVSALVIVLVFVTLIMICCSVVHVHRFRTEIG
jgi:hypothetical protein